MPRTTIKFCALCCLLLAGTLLYAQNNRRDAKPTYIKAYEQVKSDPYLKALLSISQKKPDPKWNDYQGGKIHTTDSLFFFGGDLLCHSFPTNSSVTSNQQLIAYFSQKTAKCPTLFSFYKHYQPNIESHLTAAGLPLELGLIPVVCSAFNPYADNGIGGRGYWHLNHPQGVKYGLKITTTIDERSDLEKSSKAAANYLKDLYSMYGDWELTLAAYSSGVVTVNKLLKRKQAKTYKEIYEFLPLETKEFVPSFVAMLYIYNYDTYGAVGINPVIEPDTLTIHRRLLFKAIKDVTNLSPKKLKFHNPILTKELFPDNYLAKLPKGNREKISSMIDSIYYYQDSVLLRPTPKEPEVVIPKDGETITYKVKSGDVLGSIAGRFGVRVSQIQAWNNLDGTRINIGQQLMIYGKTKGSSTKNSNVKKGDEKAQPTPKKNEPQKFNGDYTTYTVKSGDNLWLIAKKFSGVSADNIMEFNNIDANLDVGQVLKIPKP